MENDKTVMRLLTGIVIGGFLLASGGLALANAANSNGDANASKPPAAECRMPGKGGPGGPSALDSTTLSKLVEKGIISQSEADALSTYMEKLTAEQKTRFEEMKNMTAEERKAQMEARKNTTQEERQAQQPDKAGPFGGAVQEGIITAEQAQAIQDFLREESRQAVETQFKTKLAELVTAGTIDQSQADAVIAYQQAQAEEHKEISKEISAEDKAARQAEMEKLKAMTAEDRKAYMEQNKPEKPQPFKELVDNGTLSQEQADAISKIMGGFGGHRGGPGMRGPGPDGQGGQAPPVTNGA